MYRLHQMYHMTCVLATLGLVSWCYYEYSLNEDTTQIHNREFHKTPDDIYPSTTICLNSPFKEEKLQEFDPDLTTQKFAQFLMGFPPSEYNEETRTLEYGVWNKSWIDIDYDYVSYQLADLITWIGVNLLHNDQNILHLSFSVENDTLTRSELASGNIAEMEAFVSERASYYKCFTFGLPFIQGINVNNMIINFNASIFPYGDIRPKEDDFEITFGYPHQLIQSKSKNVVFYDRKVSKTSCYLLDTAIGSMEVIRARDKEEKRCNQNWKNQDEDDLRNIMERIGCNPKFWKVPSNLPYCSNNTQYESALVELKRKVGLMPPCKGIEKLAQTSFETDDGVDCLREKSGKSQKSPPGSRMMLRVWFFKETMYKEIVLVRSFTLQGLIGNAGNIASTIMH